MEKAKNVEYIETLYVIAYDCPHCGDSTQTHFDEDDVSNGVDCICDKCNKEFEIEPKDYW